MLANPHALVEGMHHRVLRDPGDPRLHLHPRRGAARRPRASAHAVAEAYAAGLPRQGHPGHRLRPRHRGARRRRRLHLRRGDGAARLARGRPRPAAAQAAVPRGRRPLRLPDRREQRRDHRAASRTIVAQRCRVVAQHGHREVPGLQDVLGVGPRRAARASTRCALGITLRELLELRRRGARGPRAEVLDPRRLLDPAADRRAPRRPAGLTRTWRRRGHDPRHRHRMVFDETTAWCARAAAGWSSTSTSPAASAPRAARATTGSCSCSADFEHGRARSRTSTTSRRSAATSLGRSFCALGDGATARYAPALKYFRDEFDAGTHTAGRGAVRPAGRHRLRAERGRSVTVTVTASAAGGRREPPTCVNVTIDGVDVSVPKGTLMIRAAEQIGDRDAAVLRPPAARPGRRLPAVPGRDRGPAQAAAGVLQPRPSPRAWCVRTQLTSEVAGKAQAGRHGVPPDQPPAGLPDLRQGRRVPAAEPGDEPRPRRVALRRRRSARSQADQRLRADPAGPRALHLVRPLHPVRRRDRRRPVHRPARAAAPTSRSAPARTSRSTPTSPATPCRSARSVR